MSWNVKALSQLLLNKTESFENLRKSRDVHSEFDFEKLRNPCKPSVKRAMPPNFGSFSRRRKSEHQAGKWSQPRETKTGPQSETKIGSTARDENPSTEAKTLRLRCHPSSIPFSPHASGDRPPPVHFGPSHALCFFFQTFYHFSRNFNLSSFFLFPPLPPLPPLLVLELQSAAQESRQGQPTLSFQFHKVFGQTFDRQSASWFFSLGVHSASTLTLPSSACAASSITVAHSGNRVVISLFTT